MYAEEKKKKKKKKRVSESVKFVLNYLIHVFRCTVLLYPRFICFATSLTKNVELNAGCLYICLFVCYLNSNT